MIFPKSLKKGDTIGIIAPASPYRPIYRDSLIFELDIIKRAILCNSKRIIIAHNHPSGSTEPSKHDIAATKKITEACNLMGINLLDHLIIGDKQFKSIIEQK